MERKVLTDTLAVGPQMALAEFGYGGVLKPSFPAWLLKERLLPPVYWQAMLRGKEWMAKPEEITVTG
jgi:sulfide:quinone oxidoreductase